ncbi:chromatin remodeling complex Adenosinetriphosphatase [Gurleya vavrai]
MHKSTIQKYREFIGPNPLLDHLLKDKKISKLKETSEEYPSFVLTETPPYINGILRHYQIEGVNWLIQMHTLRINCVLADEMGLGKTLQTITFLGHLKENLKLKLPSLLIVPKSTLNNWKQEFERFYPSYNLYILHCSLKDSIEEKKKMKKSKYDVIITTYEMCINTKILNKMFFEYVIIDEAHRIKNENSKLSLFVRGYQTNNRLLITGTPLQNNVKELWALLNFLVPELFSDSEAFDEWINKDDEINSDLFNAIKDDEKNLNIIDTEENINLIDNAIKVDEKNNANIADDNFSLINTEKNNNLINASNVEENKSKRRKIVNESTEDEIKQIQSPESSILQLRRVVMPFFFEKRKTRSRSYFIA